MAEYCFIFWAILKFIQPILAKDHFSPVLCLAIFLNNARNGPWQEFVVYSIIKIKMILIKLLLFWNDYNKKLLIKFHFLIKKMSKKTRKLIFHWLFSKCISTSKKKIKQEKKQHAVHVYSYFHLTWREFLTSDISLIDNLVKWGRKWLNWLKTLLIDGNSHLFIFVALPFDLLFLSNH